MGSHQRSLAGTSEPFSLGSTRAPVQVPDITQAENLDGNAPHPRGDGALLYAHLYNLNLASQSG
jgi:hypothetical protein